MQATISRYFHAVTTERRRLSRMEVFYTRALNCKARYAEARNHRFNRARQIVEVHLPRAAPIIRRDFPAQYH